jgi:hypothetical protein
VEETADLIEPVIAPSVAVSRCHPLASGMER